MRDKEEILKEHKKIVHKLPKESRVILSHEHLFLEVQIDTRDILRWLHAEIKGLKIS